MKIAVSAYSFHQAISQNRMTIMDVIPKAKEMGFDGVEMTDVGIPVDEMSALAPELNRQSKECGLPIIAYLVGADFLASGVTNESERLKKAVEVAAQLGAPYLRHDATRGLNADGHPVPFENALPLIADGYRRVTEFAAGLGVHTMIENHGYYAQHSSRVKAIVEEVNHKNFGWLVDIGNFMCVDEKSEDAVKVAAPYAVHAHAKDFHYKDAGALKPNSGWFPTSNGNLLRGAIVGHGVLDVPACVSLLRNAGYDGFISIEFEGIEDCLMAVPEGLQNLRAAIAGGQ